MLELAPTSTVPEWPATAGLTSDAYSALLPWLETETPTAELSHLTLACWHGAEGIRASQCGGYLLLLLADPVGYVIVVGGAHSSPEDQDAVLPVLRALARNGTITFVPPRTAMRLAALPGLLLELDRDNSDYLLDPRVLASYDGPDFSSKRKHANRCAKRAPEVLSGPLSDDATHEWIGEAFDAWLEAKADSPYLLDFRLEREGVRSWPRSGPTAENALAFALFENGRPIGISVIERMWDDVWMGVTLKTLPSVQGATEYLRRHVAGEILSRSANPGCVRWNIQQDTGAPGLRAAKTSYKPTGIVPKYRLTPRTDHA